MYFLRRRHGRKPQPEGRREAAPMGPNRGPSAKPDSEVNAGLNSTFGSRPLPEPQLAYHESVDEEPPRPVVIKKAKRPRMATPPPDEDAAHGAIWAV